MNVATITGTLIAILLIVILVVYAGRLNRHLTLFLWSLFVVIVLGTLTIFIIQAAENKALEIATEDLTTPVISQNISSDSVQETEIIDVEDITPPGVSTESIQQEEEDVLAENEYLVDSASDNQIVITFAGDVLFDPGYAIYNAYKNNGYDIANCISTDLLSEMHAADIMMVNNEFPYSLAGSPLEGKTYTFRANPDSAQILHEMGVDLVSIANNHAYDYGETALVDTLDTLAASDMPYVGAGRNIEEAARPVYFIAGDTKIGIIGTTQIERFSSPDTRGATQTSPGVFRCYEDITPLLETIKETKANCDFVIVYVHWGTENTDVLDWCQTSQAPQIVEAGADLIIGDHPHCLQEIGYIDGVPIVYSLGNFWFNSKTVDSCIVTATLTNGELTSLQFLPCLQSGCGVSLLSGDERMRVITYMQLISTTAQIDDNGYITPLTAGE